MKIKESELKNILAEVEQEFANMLKAEAADLKKAAGEESPGEDEGSEASASASPEASAPAEGGAPEGSPEASASPAAPPESPEASASAGPVDGGSPDAAMDPAAGDEASMTDPAALKEEYKALPPEELKAHYMAAKAALFELMGGGAEGSAPASPDASPAPAAPEASNTAAPGPTAPPPALKAEMKAPPATGSLKDQAPAVPDAIEKGPSLGKSERDAEVEDLKQQVELLTKAMDLALHTPVRKAVTSVAYLPKTEDKPAENKPLSKSDVQDKMRKALQSGKLTKSQRESLFSYTLGNIEFDKIKDLLDVK